MISSSFLGLSGIIAYPLEFSHRDASVTARMYLCGIIVHEATNSTVFVFHDYYSSIVTVQ